MRRADRLFDIIQVLRLARTPITAAAIAAELEVAPRTVYRDIATLQARRIPIEGAVGIGYVLRRGFELPPLMFTEDEAEAIAVGVRLLARTGDPGLQKAAESVLSKVTLVVPTRCASTSARRRSMSRSVGRRYRHGATCRRRSATPSATIVRCGSAIAMSRGRRPSG